MFPIAKRAAYNDEYMPTVGNNRVICSTDVLKVVICVHKATTTTTKDTQGGDRWRALQRGVGTCVGRQGLRGQGIPESVYRSTPRSGTSRSLKIATASHRFEQEATWHSS